MTPGQSSEYFIGIHGSELVKIGRARNPNIRKSQLQTGNPFPLDLLFSFQTAHPVKLENQVHKDLSDNRVLGEWFLLPMDTDYGLIIKRAEQELEKNWTNDLIPIRRFAHGHCAARVDGRPLITADRLTAIKALETVAVTYETRERETQKKLWKSNESSWRGQLKPSNEFGTSKSGLPSPLKLVISGPFSLSVWHNPPAKFDIKK